MRTITALLLVAVAWASPAFAQQDTLPGGTRTAWNSIVGRVTDATGGPVANVFVTVLRPPAPAESQAEPVSRFVRAVTDERGEFTLNALPLGPMYVVAIPRNAPVDSTHAVNREGLAPTYFPSAASPDDARLVTVDVSQPTRADIVLRPAPLAVVSGTIVGPDHRPVTSGTLIVAHGNGLDGLDPGTARIRPDGTFAVGGLAPGVYKLSVRQNGDTAPMTNVVVSGTDVANVRVSGGSQR